MVRRPARVSPIDRVRPERRTAVRVLVVLGFLAVLVAAFLLAPRMPAGSLGGRAECDYPYYPTTGALVGAADVIVRGTLVSITDDDSEGYPRSVATVDVTASGKGTVAPGATLTIAYTCGDVLQDLAVGREYVFLLDDLADVAGDPPPTPVNADQGFYTVQDGRAVQNPYNSVTLDPMTLELLGLS